MRITKLICDSCGKECKWLYTMPRLVVEGNNITFYNGKKELCEECARKCVKLYNEWGVKNV